MDANLTAQAVAADAQLQSAAAPLETAILLLGAALSCVGLAMNIALLPVISAARIRVQWLRSLLISLCAADVLLDIATLGLLMFQYHEIGASHADHVGSPEHRAEFCAAESFRYLWDAATNANLFTLLVMALQLLVSVRWPHEGTACLCQRGKGVQLAAAWLASAIIAVTPALLVATTAVNGKVEQWRAKSSTLFCYQLIMYKQVADGGHEFKYTFGQEEHDRVQIAVGLGVTSATFVTLAGVYAYVFFVVGSRRKFRHPVASSRSNKVQAYEEKRLTIIVSLVTVLFLLCYLPLYVIHVLGSFYGQKTDREVFAFLMAVIALAPIADPLLYSLRIKEIRSGVRQLVSTCACSLAACRPLNSAYANSSPEDPGRSCHEQERIIMRPGGSTRNFTPGTTFSQSLI